MTAATAADAVSDYYNRHVYCSGFHGYWHPIRLATTARLLGAPAADPTTGRMANLGCATGEQLIALAAVYPEASFVGVDVGEAHIENGNRLISQLGLTNIELVCGRIEEFDPGDEQFDFVVAAGMYSWLPIEVRERLLPACRRIAAPAGIIAVNFNVNPGWSSRSVVRTLIHTALHEAEDGEAVGTALGVLDEIITSVNTDRHYGAGLVECAQRIRHDFDDQAHDLFFEHLCPVNDPVELNEFVADAERSGLRYIAEAAAWVGWPASVSGLAAPRFDVKHEQAWDRLHGTSYRAAIMQRSDLEEVCSDIPGLYFASRAREVDPPDSQHEPGIAEFENVHTHARIDSALVTGALRHLIRAWPRTVPQAELLHVLGIEDELQGRQLLQELLVLHHSAPTSIRLLEATIRPFDVAATVTERPLVPHHLRVFLAVMDRVPCHDNEAVKLGDVLARIAQLLDGSRTARDVASELLDEAQAGRIVLTDHPGDPIPDIADIEQMVATGFEVLCAQGLLVEFEMAAPGS